MKVYKFGGASVRNADGVRNLRKIIDDEQNLFIIVSAMGKTTNALEKVFEGLQKGDKQLSLEHVESLRKYHAEIIDELWHEPKRLPAVDALFDELMFATKSTRARTMPLMSEFMAPAYGRRVEQRLCTEHPCGASYPQGCSQRVTVSARRYHSGCVRGKTLY